MKNGVYSPVTTPIDIHMKKTLSIRNANVLFLTTLLLVLVVGSLLQFLHLSFGLIATEVLLLMLPALLFLRARGIPFKEGLRFNPISPQIALLSALLGISTWFFSVIIDGIMLQLTGMPSVSLPEGSLPQNFLEGILYFIAIAISAPICEEILFRGAIQGAYENKQKVAPAILITSLMFAFYHMRLSGLPALLPVAFILSYVVWRTQSIYAGMLIHFGMNGTSAVHSLLALLVNGKGLPFLSAWSGLAGLVLAVAILLLIARKVPAPVPNAAPDTSAPAEPAARPESWLGTYWPLIAATFVYLGVAVITLVSTNHPEWTATNQAQFSPPAVNATHTSYYQIKNRGGDIVGDLTCQVSPEATRISLECTRVQNAYQVQTGQSYFSDIEHKTSWKAAWDSSTLDLLDFSYERKDANGTGCKAVLTDGKLIVTGADGENEVNLEESTLVEYEWFWRANMLKTEQARSAFQVSFAYILRWDDSLKKSLPSVQNEVISTYPLEQVQLPDGPVLAWKARVGSQTAWYRNDDPGFPRPVQIDDGMVTYTLVK